MKNFAFLLLLFISLKGLSQNNLIKVSPDIELIKLSENIYIHTSYVNYQNMRMGANGLIFIQGNKAFLFDSPWTDSLTVNLVSYLSDSLKLEIEGFVPNHWHVDCMGGLGYLKSRNIKSYANQVTIDIAKSKNLQVPAAGFKDSLELTLGDKSIKCFYFGPAHSMDNIVVWIPSEKILFPGCLAKATNFTNLGNTADGDIKSYAETVGKIINYFPNVKIVVPGHGEFGGVEVLRHTMSLIPK